MADIPIDWLNVDWLYVGVLSIFVFLTTIVGNLISLHHRLMGAVLSAVLFAVAFVFWTYYPHHLPLPTRLSDDKAATTTPTLTPAAPTQRPRNPITDITPPRNPITDVTPPANPPQR
ncbi:MAG TPA: hypothetical protein VEJ40_00150 [Pseudolabrys sp.]|nr:hypothetical protein [Pseudolabrys sp.]